MIWPEHRMCFVSNRNKQTILLSVHKALNFVLVGTGIRYPLQADKNNIFAYALSRRPVYDPRHIVGRLCADDDDG